MIPNDANDGEYPLSISIQQRSHHLFSPEPFLAHFDCMPLTNTKMQNHKPGLVLRTVLF